MNVSLIKKIIKKNKILEKIYTGYGVREDDEILYFSDDVSFFSNPFEIENMESLIKTIRKYTDEKKSIVIRTGPEKDCILSGYTLFRLFRWLGINAEIEINGSYVSLSTLYILYEKRGYKRYHNYILMGRDIPEKDNHIIINDETNSTALITLKLIQAYLMSFDENFGKDMIAFDIETTGTGLLDEITEIGALKLRNNCIIDTFNTLINPGMKIPHSIQILTGITDKMVKDAPPVEKAIKSFADFFGDIDRVVVHNGAFDIGFIKKRFKKYCNKKFNVISYDTRPLSQSIKPGSGLDLSSISSDFGIVLKNAHRALADAEATARVFIKITMLKNARLSLFLKWYISMLGLALMADNKVCLTGENRLLYKLGLKTVHTSKIKFVKLIYKKIKNYFDSIKIFKYFNEIKPEILLEKLKTEDYEVFEQENYNIDKTDIQHTEPIVVTFKDINNRMAEVINYFKPFGRSNKIPVFRTGNVSFKKSSGNGIYYLNDGTKSFPAVKVGGKLNLDALNNNIIIYAVEKRSKFKIFNEILIRVIDVR